MTRFWSFAPRCQVRKPCATHPHDLNAIQRTPNEFHTRVLREGVQSTIRIHYKHSALKQYQKDGRVLHTEMMFSNTQDFGLTLGWKNFACLFELGCPFNQRLLE